MHNAELEKSQSTLKSATDATSEVSKKRNQEIDQIVREIENSHKRFIMSRREFKIKNSRGDSTKIYNSLSASSNTGIRVLGEGRESTTDKNIILERMVELHKKKTTFSAPTHEPEFHLPGIEKLQEDLDFTMHDILPCTNKAPFMPFSISEIKQILSKMKSKSSPGPSTTSKRTYCFIAKYFPKILTFVINKICEISPLNAHPEFAWISSRRIIFILKKGKNPHIESNYRPISLLETLYKIISKGLANRIEPTIFKNIPNVQFGFCPTRTCSLASLTINTIIQHLKEQEAQAALLFLDLKAAFDTAKTAAINYIIRYLFSENFATIFANFYHSGTARISINNLISEIILLSEGVGQGDNASSPKFFGASLAFFLRPYPIFNQTSLSFELPGRERGGV